MIAWKSKVSVFVGSKVTLIPTPDPTKGEVKSEVLDGHFMKIFSVINLSNQSEHENPF